MLLFLMMVIFTVNVSLILILPWGNWAHNAILGKLGWCGGGWLLQWLNDWRYCWFFDIVGYDFHDWYWLCYGIHPKILILLLLFLLYLALYGILDEIWLFLNVFSLRHFGLDWGKDTLLDTMIGHLWTLH